MKLFDWLFRRKRQSIPLEHDINSIMWDEMIKDNCVVGAKSLLSTTVYSEHLDVTEEQRTGDEVI